MKTYPRDDGREDLNRQVSRIAPYCKGAGGLDVGCGSFKVNERAVGIDRNPFLEPDMVAVDTSLPWEDESQDFVASVHSLPEFLYTEAVLREWTRVLKVGGHLCLMVPDGRTIPHHPDTAHLRFHAPDELRAMVEGLGTLEVVQFDTIQDGGSFDLVARKVRHVPGSPPLRCELLGIPRPARRLNILMYSGILYRKAAEDLGHRVIGVSQREADIVVPYQTDIDLPALLDRLSAHGVDVDLVVELDGPSQFAGMEQVSIPKVQIVFHWYALHRADRGRFFDHNFITQPEYLGPWRDRGANTHWLPHAADPDYFRPFDLPEEYDVGFLGHTYPGSRDERRRLLDLLSSRHKTFFSYDRYFEEASRVYARCAMIFNRSSSLGDLNQRPFETMACGRLCLTDRIGNGLTELFHDREHLVMYGSDEELLEVVDHYLHHPDERRRIAESGRREVLSRHTYAHRLEHVLRTVFGDLHARQ